MVFGFMELSYLEWSHGFGGDAGTWREIKANAMVVETQRRAKTEVHLKSSFFVNKEPRK